MAKALIEQIDDLRTLIPRHGEIALGFIAAGNKQMFPMDFLAIAAARRSATNIQSIILMIEQSLFPTAAAILRMQLDTFFRFSAAWLVEDPYDLALRVMKGDHFSDLKDAKGKKMTDRYLVSKFSDDFPWLLKVYEETSGYIHLSEKHYWNALGNAEGAEVEMHVGAVDVFAKDEDRSEIIMACHEITEGLFMRFSAWGKTKDFKAQT